MDILDKQIKIKKFFKTVFRDIDFNKEKIRVFQNNKDNSYNRVLFFTDIDELVSFSTNKNNYNLNTYFQLATLNIDAEDGKEENLSTRYCLAFDFDRKDLGENFNHKNIVNLFKGLKIYCHAIVDSGNGYHAYVMLNKTADIEKVYEVQKVLCKRLGADKNAIKATQILRIPYTYNVKYKAKTVRIVHLADKHSKLFKPYDINFLHEKNCIVKADDNIKNDTTIKYALNNTNMPKCIQNILQNGSEEGNRYKDLQNIVVFLRQRNKDLGTIKDVCKEWAIKSNYSDSLEYRVKNIYNNKNSLELNCSQCEYQDDCYSKVISDFIFDNSYDVFILEDKLSKQCKSSKRGSTMNGNELLIVNVLKNNPDGLYKSEIVKKITYKKKCRLSDPTLIKTLKSLEDKQIIEVTKANRKLGVESFYKLNTIRCKAENTINVSYLATAMCICRLITTTELQLYHYMRYLHHQQQKNNSNALKGNLFQFTMNELAKGFYGADTKEDNKSNISVMINNLLECHILDIWDRKTSKNNNFEYYIYRLNS